MSDQHVQVGEVHDRKSTRKSSRDAFLDDVRAAGFGRKDMSGDLSAFHVIGTDVCKALHRGVSAEDLGRALFDSDAKPTLAQVRALITAAIRNLCPECEYAAGGYDLADPITMRESLTRAALDAIR